MGLPLSKDAWVWMGCHLPWAHGFGGFDAHGSQWFGFLGFLEVNAALFALQVLFGGVAWSFLAQGMTGMTWREGDCMP